jgi:hypothetical protein
MISTMSSCGRSVVPGGKRRTDLDGPAFVVVELSPELVHVGRNPVARTGKHVVMQRRQIARQPRPSSRRDHQPSPRQVEELVVDRSFAHAPLGGQLCLRCRQVEEEPCFLIGDGALEDLVQRG